MEIPTIQDLFTEYYHNQDPSLCGNDRFIGAAEDFTIDLGVRPPYKDYNSFKVVQSRKHAKNKNKGS